MNANNPPENQGEFLLYRSATGTIKVDVYFKDETVWQVLKKYLPNYLVFSGQLLANT